MWDLIRRYFLLSLMLSLLTGAAAYYLWIHRYPFTQNAFVVADIRTVTPLVSGYIESIHVRNNQFVRKGSPLFTIYQPPYRLQKEQLLHSVEAQQANLQNLRSLHLAAESVITQRRFQLKNAEYLSDRAVQMYRGAAVAQQYAEEKVRAKQEAEAALTQAVRQAESLKHQITQAEAQLKSVQKQLAVAEIWLQQTVVYAQSDGFVMNMYLSPGAYAAAGKALFAFADSQNWYVQANLQETELSELRPGLPARVWLWQYPGRELNGVVESIGWGVDRRLTNTSTGMPQVTKENDWFLLPQRYPVQIRLTDLPQDLMLHPGGSAFVQIPVPARPFRQFFWRLFQL